MNIKSIFRFSLILALVAVPLTGFAQEGEQGTAATLGQPGPWIFTFFGTEYTIPSAVAAQGDVESTVEVGYYDASTDDSPDMAAEIKIGSGASCPVASPRSVPLRRPQTRNITPNNPFCLIQ